MTREKAREAAEVMLAFARGEKIEQYYDYDGKWSEVKTRCCDFNWDKNSYRIKPKPQFNPKNLQPFDRVLARYSKDKKWEAGLFSHPFVLYGEQGFIVNSVFYICVIPYNDDTKHLVGTSNDAPEFYKYWEE